MRECNPDEDIFDNVEVVLTRTDSSDQEPLVRHHWEECVAQGWSEFRQCAFSLIIGCQAS